MFQKPDKLYKRSRADKPSSYKDNRTDEDKRIDEICEQAQNNNPYRHFTDGQLREALADAKLRGDTNAISLICRVTSQRPGF